MGKAQYTVPTFIVGTISSCQKGRTRSIVSFKLSVLGSEFVSKFFDEKISL